MSDLNAKLKVTLDSLGQSKGTKATVSQDAADEPAHEFAIASFVRNYAEKRYDNAKKHLLAVLGPVVKAKLETTIATVEKTQATANIELADAQCHNIGARVVIGGSYLDEAALREELSLIMGEKTVEIMFAKYKKQRSPTVTYIITEHDLEEGK